MLYRSDTIEFRKYKDGSDATFYGNDPPEDTSKLWFDTSVSPPILKYYDVDEWKEVNDPKVTEEYQTLVTKTNKAEEFINAADATITNKCQQVIEAEVDGRIQTIEDKTSNIVQTPESWTATFERENDDGSTCSSSFELNEKGAKFGQTGSESYTSMESDKFAVVIEGQEVASIDKSAMNIDEIKVNKRIGIGRVIFVETDNGYVEKWAGD